MPIDQNDLKSLSVLSIRIFTLRRALLIDQGMENRILYKKMLSW